MGKPTKRQIKKYNEARKRKYHANIAEARRKRRESYHKNVEASRAKQRIDYYENRERELKRGRDRYKKFRESELKRKRKWVEQNRDKVNEYRREYYARNRKRLLKQITDSRYRRQPWRGIASKSHALKRGAITVDELNRYVREAVARFERKDHKENE